MTNLAKAGDKQEKRNEKGQFLAGVSGNPEGKKKGTTSFATDYKRFIKKMAKAQNISEEDLNINLLKVAYKKAANGDYSFYRDIHDRVYGKPQQSIDHTTGGEQLGIQNDSALDSLVDKLDEKMKKKYEK